MEKHLAEISKSVSDLQPPSQDSEVKKEMQSIPKHHHYWNLCLQHLSVTHSRALNTLLDAATLTISSGYVGRSLEFFFKLSLGGKKKRKKKLEFTFCLQFK